MLKERVLAALNDQLNSEYYSSYLYLSMCAYFEAQGLRGFAHWMRVQSQEEMGHVMRFFNYINDRNGRVLLQSLEAPPAEWASPLAAFEAAYEHECSISRRIHDLARLAAEEGDWATGAFLQWFINEQVEEERSVGEVVQILRRIGEHPPALYLLDRQLAERQEE